MTQPRPETPYAETEVLLAVMNRDTARGVALLNDMSRTEIHHFINHLKDTIALAKMVFNQKSKD